MAPASPVRGLLKKYRREIIQCLMGTRWPYDFHVSFVHVPESQMQFLSVAERYDGLGASRVCPFTCTRAPVSSRLRDATRVMTSQVQFAPRVHKH